MRKIREMFKLKFIVVVLSLDVLISDPALGHQICHHTAPKPHEVVHGVFIEEGHSLRKRSIDRRLRIHVQYDGSISALPHSKKTLILEDLIPNAISFWESTLQVRQTGGPIHLLRQCNSTKVKFVDGDPYPYCVAGCKDVTMCGESIVPAQHLEACRTTDDDERTVVTGEAGAGVANTDFIMYVSAVNSYRCDRGSTLAYAAYCQQEGAMDRPVAGYVNLCPDGISTVRHDIQQMHSTIRHEILHALGFSAGLYAFFHDADGLPLTPRSKATRKPRFNETTQVYQWSDRVVRAVVRPDWQVRRGVISKTTHVVVTPRVLEEVRQHFGCRELEGAELEDQGLSGTELTHWEKRVFENEMMTGTYTQNPLVSRMTLALMEDTGWYRADYASAETLSWGRGLGCDFVQKSCMAWMEGRRLRGESVHPFCDRVRGDVLRTECTDDRSAVAVCNLHRYPDSLPSQYQHFSSLPGVSEEDLSRYGSTVILADYCPYIQEFDWKDNGEPYKSSRCTIEHNNEGTSEKNYILENYGNQSLCFEHDEPWSLKQCRHRYSVEHWGSGCYQFACGESGLAVTVGDKEYLCHREGQVISVKTTSDQWLHLGSILCPACTQVCQEDGYVCPSQNPGYLQDVQTDMEPPCSHGNIAFRSLVMSFLISVGVVYKCGWSSI